MPESRTRWRTLIGILVGISILAHTSCNRAPAGGPGASGPEAAAIRKQVLDRFTADLQQVRDKPESKPEILGIIKDNLVARGGPDYDPAQLDREVKEVGYILTKAQKMSAEEFQKNKDSLLDAMWKSTRVKKKQ